MREIAAIQQDMSATAGATDKQRRMYHELRKQAERQAQRRQRVIERLIRLQRERHVRSFHRPNR